MPSVLGSIAQRHIIVCALHVHDAQSALLEHGSPDPKEPAVHDGAVVPPLELELLVGSGHMELPMAPGLVQTSGHAVSRHAAVEMATVEGAPQWSIEVQAVTLLPW